MHELAQQNSLDYIVRFHSRKHHFTPGGVYNNRAFDLPETDVREIAAVMVLRNGNVSRGVTVFLRSSFHRNFFD